MTPRAGYRPLPSELNAVDDALRKIHHKSIDRPRVFSSSHQPRSSFSSSDQRRLKQSVSRFASSQPSRSAQKRELWKQLYGESSAFQTFCSSLNHNQSWNPSMQQTVLRRTESSTKDIRKQIQRDKNWQQICDALRKEHAELTSKMERERKKLETMQKQLEAHQRVLVYTQHNETEFEYRLAQLQLEKSDLWLQVDSMEKRRVEAVSPTIVDSSATCPIFSFQSVKVE